jgi:metallo-beta-lactamase superfamily protein
VATYVIHRGDEALVYDTYPSAEEVKWARDYLTKAGIRHFTLVNSHWHLDHVGGSAIYADVDRIATEKTIRRLASKKAAIESGTEWGPPAMTTLIDATMAYLRKLVMRAHDPNYLNGTLEDYVSDSVKRGWVSIWWAYRGAHETNLKRVAKVLQGRPLPELQE